MKLGVEKDFGNPHVPTRYELFAVTSSFGKEIGFLVTVLSVTFSSSA